PQFAATFIPRGLSYPPNGLRGYEMRGMDISLLEFQPSPRFWIDIVPKIVKKGSNRMNYNTDLTLWQSIRETLCKQPNRGPVLSVQNGIVFHQIEPLARFDTDEEAVTTLLNAGFSKLSTKEFQAR